MLRKISNFNKIVIFFVIILLLTSCSSDPLDVDVSDVNVDLQVKRFEKSLFAARPLTDPEKLTDLENNYPVFFDLFTQYILRINEDAGEGTLHVLNDFVSDPDIETVFNDVVEKYSSLSRVEQQITIGFKHHKYYFPDKPVPHIITFISGMQYAIVSADSLLGIGLDMYLGENYKFYEALSLPKFKTAKMTREYIAVDCFKGWAQSEYGQDPVKRDMLSQIVYNGKILYYIEAMLPEEDKHKIIGYTKEQLEWCRNNESSIWSFFIAQNLLYSSDQIKISKFINEGPGTGGFPPEAPAMLGNYIGWQIVRALMEKRESTSLAELMEMSDGQQILNLSSYKPKK